MSPIKKQKKHRVMWIILSVTVVVILAGVIFINQPQFGRTPQGERMERIRKSPNYRDGKFRNLSETRQITSDKGFLGSMIDFLFRTDKSLRPRANIPVVKTNLRKLDRHKDLMVWLGHSSYLIQIDGKRILVDPVFCEASPVSFVNKPFKGTDVYKPEDIPEIDYLVISHDHWDHLDYRTVMKIKERTGKVICSLGVGEHFEYWGFKKEQIIELDWKDSTPLENGFMVYCLPARHFSGRGLSPNQSLWASYLLKTPSQTIYIGGDSGYDTHFREIGTQFEIDLAILENGQYDKDWKYIHLLPEDLVRVVRDLHPQRVFTVHNSKYALGKHSWKEPLTRISEAAEKDSINLITPRIGEVVDLQDRMQRFGKWWEAIE